MPITEAEMLDPIVTTHVSPILSGWFRREDIGPRTWELPDGSLFQFAPGMPQELHVFGRFVTTIEHEPKPEGFAFDPKWWEGLAIIKTEGEVLPESFDGRDQVAQLKNSPEYIAKVNAEFELLEHGDWPREGCDRFFPEPGHCAVCDEWFDRDKVVAIRQSGVAEPFGPVSRDHPDLVSLLEGGPQRIDEVPT